MQPPYALELHCPATCSGILTEVRMISWLIESGRLMTSKHLKRSYDSVASRAESLPPRFVAALPLLTCFLSAGIILACTHSKQLALLPLMLVAPACCFLFAYIDPLKSDIGKFFYPLVLLCTCLAFALAFPPGTIPDEVAHTRVSYIYANLVMPSYEADSLRVDERTFLREGSLSSVTVNEDHLESVSKDLSPNAKDSEIVRYSELVSNDFWGNDPENHDLSFVVSSSPFYLKIGAVAGIIIGRVLNLNAVLTFYLGRIGNVLVCCALIVLAVKLTPVGKEAFIAVSLLPMTVHLIGSYSYDGTIIGLCFLCCALILRNIKADTPISLRETLSLYGILYLLGPCKMVYSIVAALGLMIPSRRFAKRYFEIAFKLGLLGMPVAGVLAIRFDKVLSLLSGSTGTSSSLALTDHRGAEYGTFFTAKDVLSDPANTIQIVYKTLLLNYESYLLTMAGGVLGWIQSDIANTQILWLLYPLLVLTSLPAATSSSPTTAIDGKGAMRDSTGLTTGTKPTSNEDVGSNKYRLQPSVCICCILLFIALILATLLGEMLIWTFNTEETIQGVQGRYFLPMLPLLLMPLVNLRCIKLEYHQMIVFTFGMTDLLYLVSIFAAFV